MFEPVSRYYLLQDATLMLVDEDGHARPLRYNVAGSFLHLKE